MKPIIAPSILSADFGQLAKDIEMINRSEAEWVHIDIMDGVFVPNISFGFPVLKYVAKLSKKPLDVHLMIVNPSPKFSRRCPVIKTSFLPSDRKSTRLNSSHKHRSRMPSSA